MMKFRFFVLTLLISIVLATNAQHIRLCGVSLHQPIDDFVAKLENVGFTNFPLSSDFETVLMHGEIFDKYANLIITPDTRLNTISEVHVQFAFKTRKEARNFYSRVIKELRLQYPEITNPEYLPMLTFGGDEGEIDVSLDNKHEIAGGVEIYPDDEYVVQLWISDGKIPYDIDYSLIGDGIVEVSEFRVDDIIPSDIGGDDPDTKVGNIDLTIPSSVSLNGQVYTVKGINKEAFSNCKKLTSINLPATIVHIAEGGFAFCDSLRSVNVSTDNLNYKSVDGVLYTHDGTTLVVLPSGFRGVCKVADGVKHLANCSMQSKELTHVVLPEGLLTIGNKAFAWDSALEEINLPSSLTIIDKSAFYGCSSLTFVDIPSGIHYLEEDVFNGCNNLKKVMLHPGMKSICSGAFSSCKALKEINLPDDLTTIEKDAFESCYQLDTLKLPRELKEMGPGAFRGCDELVLKVDPENSFFKIIDGGLYSKDGKKLLFYPSKAGNICVLPEGLEVIDNYAFQENYYVNTISLPSTLHTIGKQAFSDDVSLFEITLPKNITYIGDKAFNSVGIGIMDAVHMPEYNAIIPLSIGEDIVRKGTQIIVPDNSYDDYCVLLNSGKGNSIEDAKYNITKESEYVPITSISLKSLLTKPFAVINYSDDLLSLTSDRLLKMAEESGVNLNSLVKTERGIAVRPRAKLTIPLLGNFMINYVRCYFTSDEDKCIGLGSTINCVGSEIKVATYIEDELVKNNFKLVKRSDKTVGVGLFVSENNKNAIFVIPMKFSGAIWLESVPYEGEMYSNLMETLMKTLF